MKAFRNIAQENIRYYLFAAPVGFALGLALIYLLSVRWVFVERRLANPRVEFIVFALIGLAGMGINELVDLPELKEVAPLLEERERLAEEGEEPVEVTTADGAA